MSPGGAARECTDRRAAAGGLLVSVATVKMRTTKNGARRPRSRSLASDQRLEAVDHTQRPDRVVTTEIKVGDMVRSYNSEEGRWLDAPVSHFATFEGEARYHYLINGVVRVTRLHRFLLSGDEVAWKRAYQLRVGDKIKSLQGEIIVETIEHIAQENTVYNMDVADSDTFLVGDGQDYYIVHNHGGGGK